MPLDSGSSKKAISTNIRREYKSLRRKGKSPESARKQAVAIAMKKAGKSRGK